MATQFLEQDPGLGDDLIADGHAGQLRAEVATQPTSLSDSFMTPLHRRECCPCPVQQDMKR